MGNSRSGLGTWSSARLLIAALLIFASGFSITPALAGDVIIEDGPLWGPLQNPERKCFDWADLPRPHYYLTKSVTFSFDLLEQCEPGNVTYTVIVDREAGRGTMDIIFGQGQPNWTRKVYQGVCPGPCTSIDVFAEHPWHEQAGYYFSWAIRGPDRPEFGGGHYSSSGGGGPIGCRTNGIDASCGDYWTAHIPDSPDDLPWS